MIAAALLMSVLSAPAARAAPARFITEICDSALPGGGTAGAAFAVNPGVPLVGNNNCAQAGGALSITQTGFVSSTFSFWNLPIEATPGGTIDSITFSAQSCGAGPGNKIFVYNQGWPANCAGESQRIFHLGSSFLFGAWIYLGCDGNYPGGCETRPNVYARYIASTQVDPAAPTLGGLSGSLLGGGTIRGHQSLSVEAKDKGGGLSSVSVSVNGLPAAQPNVPNCNLVYANNPSVVGPVAVTTTPCPTALKPTWDLDTQSYPFRDGANNVQVCAADFASLSDPNRTCASATVNVDNSCTASPVPGGETLSAQFAKSNSDTLTVPYGKDADIVGTLTTNAGDPVAGATLCVKMQTLGVDARASTVGTLKTNASGNYSYKLPAGPNRNVVIGYRHDTTQVARNVRYYAHTKPILKAGPPRLENGQRVRLWGSVPGPAADRRVVVLQANVPTSKRWITFRKATTDNHGTFRTLYRFTSTSRKIKYRFRALVPDQSGYPWVQGASKPAIVTVMP